MILAYRLKSSHLEEILPFFRLRNFGGKSELSGLFVGTPTQPQSQARLVVEDLTYKGKAVGNLRSNLQFKDSILDVSTTFLEKGRSLYSFLGKIHIPKKVGLRGEGGPPPVFDLKGHVQQGQPRGLVSDFSLMDYKSFQVYGG